ncbi:hypothetical protein H721_00736 [Brucella ovis IntaBari-2006-46-332]|nr:hypothetical protein C010_00713 [Brucella ovis 80/125]ENR09953.1 hypothetical protein C961_00709 [Brucella ovis F8/05B]ENS96892.1 hypothetical protein B999_01046 [Brucella ovis 63/96]ENT00356.1 hypothetical protein C009_00729 [Brucella ovis 81/8]ENT78519.1 hypothetical protein H712_00710 [Brucella ovis IntaBari-2009-88-4]ENT82143.1 hypothetical protein H720_00712 [Brucella ovis IntaBari-2006-46-348]ENT83971.1 hypothetical protein H713_00710 [Brucella ovis IntaBari-2010-47-268]ENT89681.1 h
MSIRFRLSEADCITLNGIDHVLEHYDELGVILRARDASSRRLSFSHEEIMQLLSQPDVRLGRVCIQRNQIIAHARWTKPMNAVNVFSHRSAIRR